ncbi:hypothetical protein F5X97DRAFT_323375 [Nemania serpens]|nr:hypothetical protein F5X97DRAFT_323375 [Nemania serpens]
MGPTLSDGLEAVFDAVHDMAEGVAHAVTFGDTQTLQDGRRTAEYPTNRTLIIYKYEDIIICIILATNAVDPSGIMKSSGRESIWVRWHL